MKQNNHGGSQFLSGLPLVENDGVEGGKLISWRTPLNMQNFTDSRDSLLICLLYPYFVQNVMYMLFF